MATVGPVRRWVERVAPVPCGMRAARSKRWCQRRCDQERLGPGSGRLAERMRRLPLGADDRDLDCVGPLRWVRGAFHRRGNTIRTSAQSARPTGRERPWLRGTALSKRVMPGPMSSDVRADLRNLRAARPSGRAILGTILPAVQAGAPCAPRDFCRPGVKFLPLSKPALLPVTRSALSRERGLGRGIVVEPRRQRISAL